MNNQNDSYKIKFNPDVSSNPLLNLSKKLNKRAPKEQAPEEKSPLIRLAKTLNVNPEKITPEKAVPAIDKTTNNSVEYPIDDTDDAQEALNSQSAKTILVNLLKKFNKEKITECLHNYDRLHIEEILKHAAQITNLTQALEIYKKLNAAEPDSQEMYQAGEETAHFIQNSFIPSIERLDLNALPDNNIIELEKITELLEELELPN